VKPGRERSRSDWRLDVDASKVTEIARAIATETALPNAGRNDREARFPDESVRALGEAGLLGLLLPPERGGLGAGPRAFADVVRELSLADASLGMVFTMHTLGAATIAKAPPTADVRETLAAIARGEHLTTLALSERGSRSHFWAPVSRAVKRGNEVEIRAQKSWVTSAGHAQSYVVTTLAHAGAGPTDTTLYQVPANAPGVRVGAPFDGLGLRANASASIDLDVRIPDALRLTEEGGGFAAKLGTILPLFNLGASAVALGISRAAVTATAQHLKTSRFEHLGATLAESLPSARARLAAMHVDAEGLAARVDALARSLESPGPETTLRVLESKAAACDTAVRVTQEAMHLCGGAAFSHATSVDRHFRDAQAGPVMAPTTDHLHEFLGRALLGLPVFG
jgi:alkylation response protein AidB-like acyl-CoA dehydrogenase